VRGNLDRTAIAVDGAAFTIVTAVREFFFLVCAVELDGKKRLFLRELRGRKANRYIGELIPLTGRVVFTTSSEYRADGLDPIELLNAVLPRIWKEEPLPDGITILGARTCVVCGKRLMTSWSIRRGAGPICARRQRQRLEAM
jgi:hypothetical protein